MRPTNPTRLTGLLSPRFFAAAQNLWGWLAAAFAVMPTGKDLLPPGRHWARYTRPVLADAALGEAERKAAIIAHCRARAALLLERMVSVRLSPTPALPTTPYLPLSIPLQPPIYPLSTPLSTPLSIPYQPPIYPLARPHLDLP